MMLFVSTPLFSQIAFVNNGCQIYTAGTGNPNTNPTISIHGSFYNAAAGTIEQNASHIWLDSNWTNDGFNNVFTNNSGFLDDGFVTLENNSYIQIIAGLNPTNFENLILKSYRKQLNNNDNLTQGILELDAVLILNNNNFIINNPKPLSLIYKSGYILSETLPGTYSTLQWNIGSGSGTFQIPFGSDNFAFDDLDFTIDIISPMGANDNIKFATYPSDIYNYPLPTGASPLELEPFKVVDRYWIIEPSDPTNNPTADLTFTYSSADVASGYNSLNLNKLKASRNNTIIGKWMDMTPRGTSISNKVIISNVQPFEFFAPWTLVNLPGPLSNVFVPDAFTPDGDGLNDEFFPVFQLDFTVTAYEFYIYDRWGILQFQSNDPTEGWNGKKFNTEGVPVIGVYTWLLIVRGFNSENDQQTELREKINGKVTLFK